MSEKDRLYSWVQDGINKAAWYWYQTYGFPLELFQEEIHKKNPTLGHQMLFVNNLYKKGILKNG